MRAELRNCALRLKAHKIAERAKFPGPACRRRKRIPLSTWLGAIRSNYGAARERRPPRSPKGFKDLRGLRDPLRSGIDLGRARVGDRRLFLMLHFGSPCG